LELKPPALPWPVAFYFSEARDDDGSLVFVFEG
jgi:hypothetical protein